MPAGDKVAVQSSADQDILGTAVAFAFGSAVGIVLAYPAVPTSRSLLFGGLRFSPAETFLLIGVSVVISLPILFAIISKTMS